MGADGHPDQAPEVALKPEQPRMQQRMNCLVVVVSLFCITATVGCATLSLVSVVGQRTTVGIEYESAGRGDNVLAITYSSLCHGLLQTEKVRRYRHWTTCDLTLLRWVADGGEYFRSRLASFVAPLPKTYRRPNWRSASPNAIRPGTKRHPQLTEQPGVF